jgi:5-formyltetrahydrofolate cyclo-ligase
VTQLPPSSPPPPPGDDELRALRRQLRARRRAVAPAERRRAARHLAWRVESAGWLRAGGRLGLYLALPEEIDTAALLARALARHCRVFLPRVIDYRRHRMRFLPLSPARSGTGLRRGRYGILEPGDGIPVNVRRLDVLLMPLVGFDAQGNRIGMGKGFYDRALAFRRLRRTVARPLLVGLAFECQRVDALPARPHDIPLDWLVTETRVRHFTPRHTFSTR